MHTMILGTTESGKTTLAKKIAASLASKGKPIVVIDPIRDEGWPKSAVRFDSIEEATPYLRSNRGVYVFCDECGELFAERETYWIATRSRHYGHSVTFIAQRAVQVPRTVRDQCSQLALFRCSRYDAETHAEEWARDGLLVACELDAGEYLSCRRFGPLRKGNVFSEIP